MRKGYEKPAMRAVRMVPPRLLQASGQLNATIPGYRKGDDADEDGFFQ